MHEAPNLSLIGPMGAGKTAIGKRLAPRLGLAFVDADHALVERTGVSIAEIFEREGEAGFRAREAALLAELLAGEGVLLATGGGAVLAPANRALLAARSRVVHLRVDVRQQLRRLAHDRQRPLLQTPCRWPAGRAAGWCCSTLACPIATGSNSSPSSSGSRTRP